MRPLWTRLKSEDLLPGAEKDKSDTNAVGRKTGYH